MDEFEFEFADELDALGEQDDIDDSLPAVYEIPKSKKSLKFTSPLGKQNDDESDTKITRKRQSDHGFLDNDDEMDGDIFSPTSKSPSKKKQRTLSDDISEVEDATANMIAQIKEMRSRQQAEAQDFRAAPASQQNFDYIDRKRVSKRLPGGDFISTVGFDGERVYMKLLDENAIEAECQSLGEEARKQGGLLTIPVSVMREKLEDEKSRQIVQESIEIEESVERSLKNIDEDIVVDNSEKDGNSDDVHGLTNSMKALWVEKYAPQRYTDLLSEESINRKLLQWLKLWDYVVFGKDIPKDPKKKEKEKEQYNKFKKYQSDLEHTLDKHNRPQQLITLLCGPPGLGKTTLAHIVAKHAGYNVVEMNASDDRSADVFRTKMEAATQMKSVSEQDPRPNCLIIDEIDGAPQPAINTLLNALKGTDEKKTKKKKAAGLLLRPIICVCNDQYVPALRQLRQMAMVLTFPQTQPSKLASRLFQVVRVEHLKADLNALLALCERTDNDIRSCLNTLQFVRQKKKELTLRDVQTMNVGQKDSQKSLFTVWHDVFTMPRQKKNRFISIQDLAEGKQDSLNNNNITPTARFWSILELCQSAGESNRVMQGLHENYLEAKCKDPFLSGLNLANDWLCFCDSLNQYTAKSQDYSVMKFTTFLPIVFHFLYASSTPSKVQFPHKQTEANQQRTRTQHLMEGMVRDMSPTARAFLNPATLVLDLLPQLLDVLQPNLRPVNAQLYSSREKAELSNVVSIMIAYNMTYHQAKSEEGQYIYSLEPNMEDVVKFTGLKQRKQLTYAAKQMIAREIDLEKMRRSDHGSSKFSEPVALPSKDSSTSANVPNHLKKLQAKEIKESEPAVNFFGNFTRTKRVRTLRPDEEQKDDSSKKSLLDTLIWFHFKEGFSNAVRRTVKVQDLL